MVRDRKQKIRRFCSLIFVFAQTDSSLCSQVLLAALSADLSLGFEFAFFKHSFQ